MLPHFNWSEDEWVETGPGSKACLVKIFGPDVLQDTQWAIRYLRDHQWSWYNLIGVSHDQIPRVSPHKANGLTMVDIEHSLCECEKYSRGRPELKDISGKRHRPGKREFVPRSLPLTADVPEHWLTERVPEEHPCPPPLDGEDVYEVERIVGENSKRYRIRWLGWGPDDDTWELKEEIVKGSMELVEEWEATKKKVLKSVDMKKKDAKLEAGYSSRMLSHTRRRTVV